MIEVILKTLTNLRVGVVSMFDEQFVMSEVVNRILNLLWKDLRWRLVTVFFLFSNLNSRIITANFHMIYVMFINISIQCLHQVRHWSTTTAWTHRDPSWKFLAHMKVAGPALLKLLLISVLQHCRATMQQIKPGPQLSPHQGFSNWKTKLMTT